MKYFSIWPDDIIDVFFGMKKMPSNALRLDEDEVLLIPGPLPTLDESGGLCCVDN